VRIRECLCNATDLYPGIGQVYQSAPAVQQFEGETVEPLEGPGMLPPGGTENLPGMPTLPMPMPMPVIPSAVQLENPAARVTPASAETPLALPPT
jgi:hypothetical protein